MSGVKEFKKGKRYVFSKEAYEKSNSSVMVYNAVERYDGTEVRIMSTGVAALDGKTIFPKWCVKKSDYEILINYMVKLVQSYEYEIEKLKNDYKLQMMIDEWDEGKQLLDKIHLYTILRNEIQDILNKEVNR